MQQRKQAYVPLHVAISKHYKLSWDSNGYCTPIDLFNLGVQNYLWNRAFVVQITAMYEKF